MTLGESLKLVLADTYAFYLKTHGFHWNVTGPNFYEYHLLFERIYQEVYESVDDIGEHIRAVDEYAPAGFARFLDLASIKETNIIPPGEEMVRILYRDIEMLLETYVLAYDITNNAGSKFCGIANYLQDRIDHLHKHRWMLKASK